MILLESIVFNHDLMYKYEPQKIAKAVVMMEASGNKKKSKYEDILEPFESQNEKNRIMVDIGKHVNNEKQTISWITSLKK